MNGIRVLICGGRNYDEAKRVGRALRELHERRPIACIVQGGARGADSLGRVWAERNGIPAFECRAQWSRLGKKAGPIRNEWMLDHFKPDLVVAFPGGTGTQHMIRLALGRGVEVLEPIPSAQPEPTP